MFEEKHTIMEIPITVKWFAGKLDWCDLFKVVSYRNFLGASNTKVFGFFGYTNYTLITDLTAEQEQIYERIRKNVRYEIKRAKRENITYQMNNCSRGDFVEFYNSFAKAKGLSPMRVSILTRFPEQNLVFTQAFKGNALLVAHAYLCDTDKAAVRFQFSSRCMSDPDDPVLQKMIGWANKSLHIGNNLVNPLVRKLSSVFPGKKPGGRR